MRLVSKWNIIHSIDCSNHEEDNEMANKRKVKRQVKYPNLRRAAERMGYNFTYLWRVLERHPGFDGRAGLREDFWVESHRISAERETARIAR